MCQDEKMENRNKTPEINPAKKFKTKTHFKGDYFSCNCYWRNMIGHGFEQANIMTSC